MIKNSPNLFPTGEDHVEAITRLNRRHKLAPGLDYEVAVQQYDQVDFSYKSLELTRLHTRIRFDVIWAAYVEAISLHEKPSNQRDCICSLIGNHMGKRQWFKQCTLSSQRFVTRHIFEDSIELLSKMGVTL